jgi:hypothetical protein
MNNKTIKKKKSELLLDFPLDSNVGFSGLQGSWLCKDEPSTPG